MSDPEFSRLIRVETIGEDQTPLSLVAGDAEREALARRFGLIAIHRLEAEMRLSQSAGEIAASGKVVAKIVQACVATAEPIEQAIEAPFDLRFRPHPDPSDEEIELSETELDVIFHDGGTIDVGEAVAETLALAIDPYPRIEGAEAVLKAAGVKSEEEAGPFGALAGLRDKLKK